MLVPSPPLLWTLACLFAVLTVGTLVRIGMLGGVVNSSVQSHVNSVRTWWALAVSLAIATIFGDSGIVVLLAIAGILSLREYLQLVGWQTVGSSTTVVVIASVPIYYAFALYGYVQDLLSAAPLVFLLVLGALRAWLGLVEDYIRTTAAMIWGLLISLSGFLGDINKSGIKRDVGVKDSGTILPGQGGMMDRIDSLTFSAPVFYYFVRSILTEN